MKGRIILFLAALPFFGVGVWMGYSVGSNIVDAWQVRHWVPVQGTLLRAGFETHRGEDGPTYVAVADYRYEFGGQQYANNRVGITGGSDNIGDYQRETGRYLRGLRERREPVVVYVNPDEPSEAMIDRSLRWGLIVIKSIVFLAFGGAGLGLIIYVIRGPKDKDLSDPKYRDSPWLAIDQWQTAVIKSDSKTMKWVVWVFAILWNLVCTPLSLIIFVGVAEKNILVAMFGLVFPVTGIGLITWAVKRTREWNRFGPAPVTLDPFPGSIGGHVGGTIDLDLPYDTNAQFSLTLSNLRSYVTGSGKDKSRNEKNEWQDTQVAHMSSGAKGTRLSFRFDVPKGLMETDVDRSEDTYYVWRLNLKGDLPGVDIDRNYEIPVYETGEKSKALSESAIKQARSRQNKILARDVQKLVNLRWVAGGGRAMHFPAGRNLAQGSCGVFAGAVIAGAGSFIRMVGGASFMAAILSLLGILVMIFAFYAMLNSLVVLQKAGYIRTVRKVLGFPVKRGRMRQANIVKFSKEATANSETGSEAVLRYKIFAVARNGQKLLVGEGFKGASQADAAADFITRQFGPTPKNNAAETDSVISEYNLLTAD